jgi:hypothetical protein
MRLLHNPHPDAMFLHDYLEFLHRIRLLENEQNMLDLTNRMHVRRSQVIDSQLAYIYQEVEEYRIYERSE